MNTTVKQIGTVGMTTGQGFHRVWTTGTTGNYVATHKGLETWRGYASSDQEAIEIATATLRMQENRRVFG